MYCDHLDVIYDPLTKILEILTKYELWGNYILIDKLL